MANPIYITLAVDPKRLAIVKQIAEDIARVQKAWAKMAEDMGLLIETDDDDELPDPNKWQFRV